MFRNSFVIVHDNRLVLFIVQMTKQSSSSGRLPVGRQVTDTKIYLYASLFFSFMAVRASGDREMSRSEVDLPGEPLLWEVHDLE